MPRLSHLDDKGRARMVDVSDKDVTRRVATAVGSVRMAPKTLALILEGKVAKGDVLTTARLAGVMAAKRTADLIPLCHPLSPDGIFVELKGDPERSAVDIEATVKLSGRTGVEMEALTAVSVAALTVYDMCKAADKSMVIGGIHVIFKSGGRSGTFRAE
ncbi:MAG: cyclic pyranopterin monophosphate synthase MoaC [Sphingomonadales bacterium]